MAFIIALLDPARHDRTAFDCGEADLNDYLQKTARQHLEKGIANTYVLVSSDAPATILGFFTLSFLEVDLSQIPQQYRKRFPHTRLPAAKLGRLAVARRHQGENLGRLLVANAVKRVADAIRNAAGVVGLFIDAKTPQLASFYSKFGFIPLDDTPLTLMLARETIVATFPESSAT